MSLTVDPRRTIAWVGLPYSKYGTQFPQNWKRSNKSTRGNITYTVLLYAYLFPLDIFLCRNSSDTAIRTSWIGPHVLLSFIVINIQMHTFYAYHLISSFVSVLLQCQYNSDYCDYEGYFERVVTNMGFCLSFNPSKFCNVTRICIRSNNKSDFSISASWLYMCSAC